jgi:hypothetical protein
MDLSGPQPIETRTREIHADFLAEGLNHERAIVETLCDIVRIGCDDEHIARAARTLVLIDEGE